MGVFTSRFALYKPGGGSTGVITPDEVIDIDKLNANFDIIDANLGVFLCTSVTRPGVPKDGQLIFETDTKRFRVWRTATAAWEAADTGRGNNTTYTVATLNALDGLTDALVGDEAFMTTPGTGINALAWIAYAGAGAGIDWRPIGTVVSDTKAHLDTFIAAVAAIADTRFEVGKLAFVTGTNRSYRFTTDVGALKDLGVGTWAPITPTSVVAGSGTAAIGAGGRITLTTVGTSLAMNLGITSADYEDVRMRVKLVTSLGGALTFRLRTAVPADDSSANYDTQYLSGAAAAASAAGTAAQTSWPISDAAGKYTGTYDLIGLTLAESTEIVGWVHSYNNPAGTASMRGFGHGHRSATAFAGGTILISSGTVTGDIWFEGRVV